MYYGTAIGASVVRYGDEIPAVERPCRFKVIRVRDRSLIVTCGREECCFGRVADGAASTGGCHIEFVRSGGLQASENVRLGGIVHNCVEAVRAFLVIESPGGLATTRGPVQGGGVAGNVGGGKLIRNLTAGHLHLHIVHIPIPIGIIGIVAESNEGTGRCSGEVFGLLNEGVRGPVIIAVGVDCHESGGIRQVSHIAHVKGAAFAVI